MKSSRRNSFRIFFHHIFSQPISGPERYPLKHACAHMQKIYIENKCYMLATCTIYAHYWACMCTHACEKMQCVQLEFINVHSTHFTEEVNSLSKQTYCFREKVAIIFSKIFSKISSHICIHYNFSPQFAIQMNDIIISHLCCV